QDLYDSIQSNGFLLTVFRYKFTEPEIALNSLNRKSFLNNNELKLRLEKFVTIAKSVGFRLICKKCDKIGTQWFGVLQERVIEAKEADNQTDNVWLIANDSSINGIIGLMNCLRLEPGGGNWRYIFNYDSTGSPMDIDFNVSPYSDILANDLVANINNRHTVPILSHFLHIRRKPTLLVANVVKEGKVGTYRHLRLPTDYDKCLSNDYHLNSSKMGDLGGIKWYDSRNIHRVNEIWGINNQKLSMARVEIYYSGITFKDIMLATGRIPSGSAQLFTDCSIGCEYTGRRADTGERVMGLVGGRSIATSINANISGMTKIPDHWSMAEASTIMNNYGTLWYGLIKRANLKKGESILIHSAAGGIGQSAINICKHYECDIYVTVGTDEKKQFLMNEYNIPEKRILNSRDILFKNQVLELTNGKGVDIVINSLAGEKLDASYECLANCGRFIEIGKFDMLQNKKLGMFDFLRDIQFIGVGFDVVNMENPNLLQDFYNWMHKNCTNGCVKPYNYTLYNASDADKAFRFMTTGKHIGKVVLKIRDEETDRQPLKAIKPAVNMMVTVKTYFNPNKVYIITGGLGGFGMELVPWMIYYGARKFVVTSRSGLTTDYQKYIYNRFQRVCKNYKYFSSDWVVSTANGLTIEGTQQLLKEAQKLGPIGGVFHLALELNDYLIEKLTLDKFYSTIDTKHKIFANLDQLTRKLDYNLDYFVVFSSLACGKGNGCQTNYSFGNSMCERICEQRRRDGLHGLAVQYGPIDDVGVFDVSDDWLSMSSIRKQRIHSCCDVLDKLLAIKQPIVTSYIKADQIKNYGYSIPGLATELWRSIGIDPETTPNHLTLGEIGLESIFANQLQQDLEREWKIKITLNQIKSITIGLLKDYEAGNVDNIKAHIDDIKRSKAKLLNQKFVMPTEKYERLNTVTKGRPVYIMPTLGLNFQIFGDLAHKLTRPVIGLNWAREVSQLTTLKDINKYYVDLLQRLEPKGQYDVVGYFDMSIVCAKLLLKGMVDKAVIVDIISDLHFCGEQLSDDLILELMLQLMASYIPELFRQKILRDFKKEPDINAKVRFIVNEILEFAGKGLQAPDMEEIFHVMIARIRMLSEYRLNKHKKFSNRLKLAIAKKWTKRTGKLVFIKPVVFDGVDDVDELMEKSRDLYFIPGSNDGQHNIEMNTVHTMSAMDVMVGEVVSKIIAALK
ncbi:unnamed protein product, partial [Oppiella nova]